MNAWELLVLLLVGWVLVVLYASTRPAWAMWLLYEIFRPVRWIEDRLRGSH